MSHVAEQPPRVILLLPPDRSFDRVEIRYVLYGPFGASGRSITLNSGSRSVEIQASEEGKLADHIKLLAPWACRFFGFADCLVPQISLGTVVSNADGAFEIDLPTSL